MKRNFRKPLIVMTPKSLLRHKDAVSPVERVHRRAASTKCSTMRRPTRSASAGCVAVQRQGLLRPAEAAHGDEASSDVAIVRVEQFYPFPEEQLRQVLGRYRRAKEWVWVQEESQNMGGWTFVEPRLRALGYRRRVRRPRRQRQPGDRLAPGPRARAEGAGRGGAARAGAAPGAGDRRPTRAAAASRRRERVAQPSREA